MSMPRESVVALHPGDLRLVTAWAGTRQEPALSEDANEPTRADSPSVIALDPAGTLHGHAALQAAATPGPERVTWRYRREALATGAVLARDAAGNGVTSETYLACAARRAVWESRVWGTASDATIALVLPHDTPPEVAARLRLSVSGVCGRSVAIVGEPEALAAACGFAGGLHLVASLDDDALRVRLVRRDAGVQVLAEEADVASGLRAIRERWLEEWQEDLAAVAPDGQAFGDGENAEFERVWQDGWDAVDDGAHGAALVSTMLRRSRLHAVIATPAGVASHLRRPAEALRALAGAMLAQFPDKPLQVVIVAATGGEALRKALERVPALAGIPVRIVGRDAYARGGAAVAQRGTGSTHMAIAPHPLGVIGYEDGGARMRPLFDKGVALPATAQFAVAVNRDAQQKLAITLSEGVQAGSERRHEFGPLLGSGVQRIGVTVTWTPEGVVQVEAADRDDGTALPSLGATEIRGGVPLVNPAQWAEFA